MPGPRDPGPPPPSAAKGVAVGRTPGQDIRRSIRA